MPRAAQTLVRISAAAVVCLASACAASAPRATISPRAGEIAVVDIGYAPKTVTVKAGESVTWVWTGRLAHSVTADDRSFDSDIRQRGARFTHTFNEAGTFGVYCSVHSAPTGNAQNATIIVTP